MLHKGPPGSVIKIQIAREMQNLIVQNIIDSQNKTEANVLLNKEMIPFYGDNYSPVNFNLSSLKNLEKLWVWCGQIRLNI